MIDLKTVELELAQARQARIAAQLAGCELEELADTLRQTHAVWARPQPATASRNVAPGRGLSPQRFVCSP